MAEFVAICPVTPGEKVKINGDIDAVVEQVQFCRGRPFPLLLVAYWHEGDIREQQVHLDDVEYLLEVTA